VFSAKGPRDQFQVAANGITRFGLGGDAINAGVFPVPPEPEQRAIAAFLDRETARIDALVAKKERLIELLEERRTAMITHGVVRGFDAGARMTATGTQVFPQVPRSWRRVRLRRLLNQVTRPIVVELDSVYQEIGIRSWGNGIFHKAPIRGALLEDKNVFEIRPGDLILNIVFAWEGAVAVAAESEQGMIASHRFPTFRHDHNEVDLDYMLMLLQSEQGRALMAINSPGAAGRNRTIRLKQLLEEEVPLPPVGVQKDIVRQFRRQERALRLAERHAERLMGHLKELRAALISAAATGSIDVREEAV
jgi:type I restriction enzyme S subunit